MNNSLHLSVPQQAVDNDREVVNDIVDLLAFYEVGQLFPDQIRRHSVLRTLERQCKLLRLRISGFKRSFEEQHGHKPEDVELCPIVPALNRYSKMTNHIREYAATLIQSAFRTHLELHPQAAVESKMESDIQDMQDMNISPNKESPQSSPSKSDHSFLPPPDLFSNNLYDMDESELKDEKQLVRVHLKEYDSNFEEEFGRKPSKEDKEPIRYLYDRYHTIKILIANAERQSIESVSPTHSLQKQLDSLRIEKRYLQTKLRDFEKAFQREHNRKVRFVEDIKPVVDEYQRYKALKAEIKSLEEKLNLPISNDD
eukprot:TRINITY_DN773170_c0_g1_i1.p1 TRINITY_DN773170_c0_g1~~TRINITY_DN773170_c0_g1_i1.p1  ORF type:complete len:312 (-),score=70.32 TRINITY_DN773170_c0_g1_i1:236-1171(-)